jgi:hypothetical protein
MDAPWYADIITMLVFFSVGFFKCVNIAFLGHTLSRWLEVLGWLGLTGRFAYGLVMDGNVPVNPAAELFLLMIAAGSLRSSYLQLSTERFRVYCIQDASKRCYREDRVHEAMRRRFEP